MARTTLISTVGTSLLSNIKGQYRPDFGVSEEVQKELQALLKAGNSSILAARLAKLPADAKICGAEINSIEDAIKRGRVEPRQLVFMVSDTADGEFVGKILESYYVERGIQGLQSADSAKIDDLQDEKPNRFRVYGLRNLVRKLGKLVSRYTSEAVVIDATGGYKAQIAIAVVFGQVLQIPVLYRHERFSEIIDFPPLPVAFDYSLLGENAALLAAFEAGEALTSEEMGALDEKIRVLLEEIEVDGTSMYELGAIGQIYLTGFRLRFPRARELKPLDPGQKTLPSFRDDHYPLGFKTFIEKLCESVLWIKTAHSLPYSGQKGIKAKAAYVREGKLIVDYKDKNNFGARAELLTEASDVDQLAWAADQLNQYFANE